MSLADQLVESDNKSTVSAIMTFYKDATKPKFSKYLSMKDLGKPCAREQWLNFRWATLQQVEGRIARLFKRGHREEPLIVQDLRDIGCIVHDLDENGKQTFLRGEGILSHLVGARDAVVENLPEDPDPHLADFKTSSLKKFEKMVKGGVASVYPEYITQLHMYMGYSGIYKGFILAVCKDNDDLYLEFVTFDPAIFKELNAKGARIISLDRPPLRLHSKGDRMSPCTFCKHQRVCYGEEVPEVNCRTCIHSTPTNEGGWRCELKQTNISTSEQEAACDKHLYIPEMLVGYEAVEGNDEAIAYDNLKTKQRLVNAVLSDHTKRHFTSKEMKEGLHETQETSEGNPKGQAKLCSILERKW